MSDVTTAWIAAGGAVVVALITAGMAYLQAERARCAEKELKADGTILPFGEHVMGLMAGGAAVNHLFDETAFERFLLLVAVNGSHDPKTTTAVWQMRRGSNTVEYVRVELDKDYVERLRVIRADGTAHWPTKEMDAGVMIRDIYEAEGVHDSFWAHLYDQDLGDGRCAIVYMSLATLQENVLGQNELTKARLLRGLFKHVVEEFDNAQKA